MSCSTCPALWGHIVTKLCMLQNWQSARCWPPSGPWAAIGRSCAKPLCGTAASAKARWLPLARLRRGEPPDRVLDDRFVEAFAIAGTAEECLATAARYGDAGVHELVLTFVGAQAAEQMAHLGRALAEHRV